MSECSSVFVDIFQLWEKAINKHVKSHTEQGLEFYLDDMQDACIYFDSFHSGLSKDKIIEEDKSVELFKRLEDLNQKLGSIFENSQKRFFED